MNKQPSLLIDSICILIILFLLFSLLKYMLLRYTSFTFPKIKTVLSIFIVIFLVIFLTMNKNAQILLPFRALISQSAKQASPSAANVSTLYRVKRIIDGDTIELTSGEKLRYIGINTPESVDPRKPVQCFAHQASEQNKKLVEGKLVRLEKDISDKDKYGRLLRYVYVDNIFVNDYLVKEGYALASSYPPDIKYQKVFQFSQQEAINNNKGLWKTCPINESKLLNALPCTIKGNITSQFEKIYHTPECPNYSRISIDLAKGEQYFCSELEASQSGYRKAQNCVSKK